MEPENFAEKITEEEEQAGENLTIEEAE